MKPGTHDVGESDMNGAARRMRLFCAATSLLLAVTQAGISAAEQENPPSSANPASGRAIADAGQAPAGHIAGDQSRPATLLGNPGAFFGADAYPAQALRARQEGRTTVRLEIDAQGSPTKCTLLTSSGSSALDDATCQIATRRIRYSPALDGRGHAMASHYTMPVRWMLPTDGPMPPLDLTNGRVELSNRVTRLDVGPDGKAMTCTVVDGEHGVSQPCPNFQPGVRSFPTATIGGRPSASVVTVRSIITLDRPDR